MKCHQCNRPALYNMGDSRIFLCLDCYSKVSMIQNMEFVKNAVMQTQAIDQMDMCFGFPTEGGRLPIGDIASAMQGKAVNMNNITISNSNVGVINTGNLARIDAVITLTEGTDYENIGIILKRLTQAVIDTEDLDENTRKESLELIQSLSEQIVGTQGATKKSVIKALFKSLENHIQTVSALVSIGGALGTALKTTFGI